MAAKEPQGFEIGVNLKFLQTSLEQLAGHPKLTPGMIDVQRYSERKCHEAGGSKSSGSLSGS